jgi:hypothetical protein
MTPVHQLGVTDVLVLVGGIWLVFKVVRRIVNPRPQGTRLLGPPSESLLFGVSRRVAGSPDTAVLYEEWAAKYGPAFDLPIAFGGRRTILCDPKAVNHFYSMERTVYAKSTLARTVIANLVLGYPCGW